jgi:predicted nucleotidyltransferase
MEIHKEELKIIDLFRKDIFSKLTIKEIMQKLNKRSYNWTFNAIKKLSKNILISEKRGNTSIIRLNLESPLSITYLSYLDKLESNDKKIPLMNEILENVSKVSPFFILLVAGSYATNNARKDSDIDLVMISENKKNIQPYINQTIKLSGISFDVHIFAKDEFLKMLLSDTENFGKEVFRKHLIFYGNDAYYQIIKEAIKNGLQTKI